VAGTRLSVRTGPEVMKLPSGAGIYNPKFAKGDHGPGAASPAFEGGWVIRNEQPIYIGRRQIGEAVGDYVAERDARR
jgi:hypothetical protein